MKREDLIKYGADRFFDFMAGHGATWWFCEAQPRKKNGGQRGAPIGKLLGFSFGVHHQRVVDSFVLLTERLDRLNKKQVDLQTRESASHAGGRVILVDDLFEHSMRELIHWWSGPVALLETSPGNFQALLVAPRPLRPDEHLVVAQMIADRFDADQGAAQPKQLHRFPGALNFKPSVVTADGQPFASLLVALNEGEADGSDQLENVLTQKNQSTRKKVPRQKRETICNNDSDNSSKAFRWTLHQLRTGTSHGSILSGLRTRWLSHHDSDDWPERTFHNALYELGTHSTRYKAGPYAVSTDNHF